MKQRLITSLLVAIVVMGTPIAAQALLPIMLSLLLKSAQNQTELDRATRSIEAAKTEQDAVKRAALLDSALERIASYREKENELRQKERVLFEQESRMQKNRLELLSKSKNLVVQASALQDRTVELEAERTVLLSQKFALEQERGSLQREKESLTKDKETLTKERDTLEVREKVLATGLIASLVSLVVALSSGFFKWPLIRLERRLTELKIDDMQTQLLERKQRARRPYRREA